MQPESMPPVDANETGIGTDTGKPAYRRGRDQFPPSPKSVRTWSVPVPTGQNPEPVELQAGSVATGNKSAYRSQLVAIACAAGFLAGLLAWLLAWLSSQALKT